MKPRPRLLFILSFVQTIIGCFLAGFGAIVLDMFYFVIGICNMFIGAIVYTKSIQEAIDE
jgi:hypothetical protein